MVRTPIVEVQLGLPFGDGLAACCASVALTSHIGGWSLSLRRRHVNQVVGVGDSTYSCVSGAELRQCGASIDSLRIKRVCRHGMSGPSGVWKVIFVWPSGCSSSVIRWSSWGYCHVVVPGPQIARSAWALGSQQVCG